jgi:hypothetical protein
MATSVFENPHGKPVFYSVNYNIVFATREAVMFVTDPGKDSPYRRHREK